MNKIKASLRRFGLFLAGLVALLLVAGCLPSLPRHPSLPATLPADLQGPGLKGPSSWVAIPVPPVGAQVPAGQPATSEDRITERNNQIADLKAQIAKLNEENTQEEARQRREAEAQVRAVLYWASVVAFGLAAVATVLCFIPILSLFRATTMSLAAGFTLLGFLAIGLAPTIQYAGWVVGGIFLVGLIGGLTYLWHLYRTGLVGKIAAHAADQLEAINPLDVPALQHAKGEIASLQAQYGVSGLTESLRKVIRVPGIPDQANPPS